MADCTCTTYGRCAVCRPPCDWCGDDYHTRLGTTPLCVSCYEFALLHREENA
jgi:hypothetical protein